MARRKKPKRCWDCLEIKKEHTYGLCKEFGFEIAIDLAKRDAVCRDWGDAP